MYLQVQHPFFDGRPLLGASSLRPYPRWQEGDVSGQYIRGVGKIMPRRLKGVEGLTNETFFCQLRNSLKAGDDWLAPFPDLVPRPAAGGPPAVEDAPPAAAARRPQRDGAGFVARRLFFDGLYSGKIDLGVVLPRRLNDELAEHPPWAFAGDGEPGAEGDNRSPAATRPLDRLTAVVRHVLKRSLAFGSSKGTVGRLGGRFAQEYARATTSPPAESDLVTVGRASAYLEILSPRGERWNALAGWTYDDLGFAEIYGSEVGLGDKQIPLFVARVDRDQANNRGRHLRVGTLKYISELTNAITFAARMASYYADGERDVRTRYVMHTHLKQTVKFLAGQNEYDHIKWAREVVRKTVLAENMVLAVDRLAEINEYWDAERRRSFVEVVMGDKIGGDKISAETGGVAVGRGTQIAGGVQTASQVSNQSFDLAQLSQDLLRVSQELRKEAKDPIGQMDADIVEKAAAEAKEGNESNVVALLKKVGTAALDVSQKIAASVAIAFLSAKLGLK